MSAREALERIRTAASEVVDAAWWNLPSAFEIDTKDREAIAEMLRAIVEAALQEREK